jgi:hypothetical protein
MAMYLGDGYLCVEFVAPLVLASITTVRNAYTERSLHRPTNFHLPDNAVISAVSR